MVPDFTDSVDPLRYVFGPKDRKDSFRLRDWGNPDVEWVRDSLQAGGHVPASDTSRLGDKENQCNGTGVPRLSDYLLTHLIVRLLTYSLPYLLIPLTSTYVLT